MPYTDAAKSISRKALEIIRCSQCYNFAGGAYVSFCMHPMVEEQCEENPRNLLKYKTDPGYIPEWCPLEDWPEEGIW
jgi:hypothetical protein